MTRLVPDRLPYQGAPEPVSGLPYMYFRYSLFTLFSNKYSPIVFSLSNTNINNKFIWLTRLLAHKSFPTSSLESKKKTHLNNRANMCILANSG